MAATEKAEEDDIPLFGWAEDGWLDLCNAPTNNHQLVVDWFVAMKKRGFRIREVGHDRKFCREYFIGMKKAGFKIIDQPQYFYKKSEGFRHIEAAARNHTLYYLGQRGLRLLRAERRGHREDRRDGAIRKGCSRTGALTSSTRMCLQPSACWRIWARPTRKDGLIHEQTKQTGAPEPGRAEGAAPAARLWPSARMTLGGC